LQQDQLNLDKTKSTTRAWSIKVTQYDENDDHRYVPPPNCLQWHTGSVGTIKNFNYKDTNSYHLSSQRYSICWRRERNKCGLCLSRSGNSFGMSNIPSQVPPPSTTTWTTKAGYSDSICGEQDTPTANSATSGANDFLEIDNVMASPFSASSKYTTGTGNRFCGRWTGLSTIAYGGTPASVTWCTGVIPFRVRVRFSDGEVLTQTSANLCGTSKPTANTGDTSDECSQFRKYGNQRGTLGFGLVWWQVDC